MYLEQLEYLLEISKHKSIASASTMVHLTPQALSLSIKRLEEELQVPLLTRTSKGVFLTEEGKELVELSSRFFEDLSKFQNKKNTAPITEDIYFLTSQEEHGSILLPILCDLYRQYPQINFFSKKNSRDLILNQLVNQEASIGFLFRHLVEDQLINFPTKDLKFIPLFKRKIVCQIHKSFPISSYKSISVKTLQDIPIIIYHPRNSNNYSMEDILQLFFQPNNIIYEENCLLIKQMISAGLGCSFTISSPLKNLGNAFPINELDDITTLSLKEKIECEYGIAYHKDYKFSISETHFIQFIKRYLELNQIYDSNIVL